MQDLWFRTFQEVAKEYPDITTDYAHVDATTMWMVKNPEWFDVIVTENMFGDIITDLGAMIQGGMGVAAGGNINPGGVSMFEPIGGSAPKYTGQNVINPIAAILAAAMMLEQLGHGEAAAAVERSVVKVIGTMPSMAAGKMGHGTKEIGDLVAAGALGLRELQGSEVVFQGLRPADLADGAVPLQEKLRRAQLAVVVEPHGVPVGARVVDHHDVALLDLRELAVDGELVVVLAQRAGDVVEVIRGLGSPCPVP